MVRQDGIFREVPQDGPLCEVSDGPIEIRPQPGPQTEFLTTLADIAIYGGAAGSGKSFALLIEPLRHYTNSRFGGVIFRRSTVQIRNEGGLWDEAVGLYPLLNATMRESVLEVDFPSGSRMKFSHLEHEKTVYDWQGSQIPYIGWDELCHFTKAQFFYMMSRNRSTSGVPGYMRATCNPDADSWVKEFIQWWLDPLTGYAIPERAGKLRWFIRQDDEIIWADTKDELIARFGAEALPKSVTFIPAKIQDNAILMAKDPAYLANLKALSKVDRMRLLEGNWNIRPSAGMYFRREWFPVVKAPPGQILQTMRYWDRAATEPSPSNPDPDWTVGLKMAKLSTGQLCVMDVVRFRKSPLAVESAVKNTATQDGSACTVGIEQDPGSAGVADAGHLVRKLMGHIVKVCKPTAAKDIRAKPVSAQAEAGNILVMEASWNEEFFAECAGFPDAAHDDQVDTLSGAFNELASGASVFDAL